jgi:hypothetical protein
MTRKKYSQEYKKQNNWKLNKDFKTLTFRRDVIELFDQYKRDKGLGPTDALKELLKQSGYEC